MNDTPTVSVVMSCYNTEISVFEAVKSILDQSFSDFEFIIIDDGSSDSTNQILTDLSNQDDRITILENEENIGLAASLNKGIDHTKGKYIARMDADDFALPERLEKQVAFLNSHPEVDILGSSAYTRLQVHTDRTNEINMPSSHDAIVNRVFKKTMVLHPTIMVRSEVFDIARYDPELRWAEDADLWFRIYDKVGWANLEEPLLIYTIKEGLTKKIVNANLSVIVKNLKKRGKLLCYLPYILRYFIEYNLRLLLRK